MATEGPGTPEASSRIGGAEKDLQDKSRGHTKEESRQASFQPSAPLNTSQRLRSEGSKQPSFLQSPRSDRSRGQTKEESRKPTLDLSPGRRSDASRQPSVQSFSLDTSRGRRSEGIRQPTFQNEETHKALSNFQRECDASEALTQADELMNSGNFDELVRSLERLLGLFAPQLGHLQAAKRFCRKVLLLSEGVRVEAQERLQRRVDSLEHERSVSGKAYLQELANLRSKTRQVEEDRVSFSNADGYYWDALEALPEEQRGLVADVIAEKLRCHSSQSVGATIAEFQAISREYTARLKELEDGRLQLLDELHKAKRAVEMLEKQLDLRAAEARAMEQARLDDFNWQQRCRLLESQLEQQEMRMEGMMQELARLRPIADEGRLAKLEKEVEEFRFSWAVRETEQSEDDSLASFAEQVATFTQAKPAEKSRLRRSLRASLKKDKDVAEMPTVENFLALTASLSRKKGSSIMERFAGAVHTIIKEQRDHHAKASDETQQKNTELEDKVEALNKEMKGVRRRALATTEELVEVKAQLKEANLLLQHERSRFEEHLRKMDVTDSPVYQDLLKQYEEALKMLEDTRHLLESANAYKLQTESLAAELKATEDSLLHPSQVAGIKAELRRTRYENEATQNANATLREAVETLTERLEVAEKRCQTTNAEVANVLATCDRTVYNRLYEDAIRRHERLADIWDALRVGLTPVEAAGEEADDDNLYYYSTSRSLRRSASTPGRLRDFDVPMDVRNMLVLNARAIGRLYGRQEPLLELRQLRRTPTPEVASAAGAGPTAVVLLRGSGVGARPHSAPSGSPRGNELRRSPRPGGRESPSPEPSSPPPPPATNAKVALAAVAAAVARTPSGASPEANAVLAAATVTSSRPSSRGSTRRPRTPARSSGAPSPSPQYALDAAPLSPPGCGEAAGEVSEAHGGLAPRPHSSCDVATYQAAAVVPTARPFSAGAGAGAAAALRRAQRQRGAFHTAPGGVAAGLTGCAESPTMPQGPALAQTQQSQETQLQALLQQHQQPLPPRTPRSGHGAAAEADARRPGSCGSRRRRVAPCR
eukprot:TRINITY_DN28483_c0_g1_i1.p1 TRINITY_DN28483_c0_g1~~TRINITY_DN28483_c0_g1_i1.p1  ORF type:complete len:1055 (+),score=265.35 TRINITY_DN28483_c0_g1_i1:79-3243(+)